MCEVNFTNKAPPRFRASSVSVDAAWGKFTPTLEDVPQLIMLLLFGEANAMGIVLVVNDQTKLKYLTTPVAAWKSSESTYATWLRFFNEGATV